VADARSAVRRQMTRLEAELLGMSSENGALSRHLDSLREQLGALEARNADLAALRAAQERRLHALDDQLAQAAARAQLLQAEAGTLRQTLARAERDRDEAVGAGATLRARVADLEGRLAANEELHRRTVQRYADHALANILQLEALVGRTGVKADALLPPSRGDVAPSDSRRRGGQGGPFVPWRPGAAAPPPLEELGLALADRIDRLELLRELVRALPLNAPLDEATQMSGFGYRRDPITNAPAMHLGIDFSAPMRSPVYPAAPGEVVFAGWQGDYGRVVDVDHGFGIRTRYAHLARIDVAAGERVAIGRSIGLLGNSGRTTGPHLHYEVLVKGRNVDPMKFMRARSHVLQAK
jgi:murein DD-endopeptidase MepM/ murein hydrolase activator NlpD